jgi:Xaa-Pro aminopeptidase
MPTPSTPPTISPCTERLALLRTRMAELGVEACIVPSSDPHLSEYLPPRWQARQWLSGFTGSVGTLIVTSDFAGVWTDGRYWIQAETELAGSGIALMKIPSGASLQHIDWLAANLRAGHTVAVDADVLGLAGARLLAGALAARDIKLRTDLDLPDQIWRDRPALPLDAVYEHLAPFATVSRRDKLALVRVAMADAGASYHLLSTLDDIAWLFNLRGSDVSYNPVFVAHALLDAHGATLFVGAGKITPALSARLQDDGVRLAPYSSAAPTLAALSADSTLLIDPRRVTAGLLGALPASVRLIETVNPSTIAKSRKNAAEAAHVRLTMEHDGAALCEFFAWLDARLDARLADRAHLTELDIDREIAAARARRPHFVSPSFGTIAGFNANGAIIHYRASEQSHAVIEGDGLLLIDSGGQYLGGTTDITRVVAVGTPQAAQRRDVTLVLKGLIALSSARFPRATRSPMLDALARAPLWAEGLDYGHGTGHGVGYFLNVHEGPQSISASAMPEPHTAMEAGMITSIEPGLYRPGHWGVRLENLALAVDAGSTEFGDTLRFETLTLCPIDTRCLEPALLRADELAWLNDYHTQVRARLSPHVDGAALTWLNERTKELH